MAFQQILSFRTDVKDFNAFIKESFAVSRYNFVEDMQVDRGGEYYFEVVADIDQYMINDVNAFIRGKAQPYITQSLLNYLCAQGAIQPGMYFIEC